MYSSTLRPCSVGLAPSSGLLLTSRPPPSRNILPLALGPGGHHSLKLINPRSDSGVVRASTGAACDRQVVVDYEFREEQNRIQDYFKKIYNAGVLRSETAASRGYLCMIAKNSVRLASVIMGKPGNIFPDTLLTKLMTPTKNQNRVLQVCARTFVNTAEDAYHDKVTKETIVSFLRSLERLAAMSYFVAQDTLANVGDYKVISLNYRPEFDADRDRFEYMEKMDTLKHDLNMARTDEDRVLRNIVADAMLLTEPFVMSMTACRANALLGLTLGASTAAAF